MKKMKGAFSLNLLVGTVRPPDTGVMDIRAPCQNASFFPRFQGPDRSFSPWTSAKATPRERKKKPRKSKSLPQGQEDQNRSSAWDCGCASTIQKNPKHPAVLQILWDSELLRHTAAIVFLLCPPSLLRCEPLFEGKNACKIVSAQGGPPLQITVR